MSRDDASTIPSAYAQALGMHVEGDSDGVPIIAIDFSRNLEGRPGTLHGGAISGVLETAGYAALRHALAAEDRCARLKPVNITIQFLRAGTRVHTQAVGRIKRLGRRNANVIVEAWQEDRDRPIATAVMNILMDEEG